MPVNLSKGGKVSLAKAAADAGVAGLSKVAVGLGWDTNRYDGGSDFDLDASAFLVKADGKEAAFIVGQTVAKNAMSKGIKTVVFDRAGYQYTGRVKAVADGARDAGLEF